MPSAQGRTGVALPATANDADVDEDRDAVALPATQHSDRRAGPYRPPAHQSRPSATRPTLAPAAPLAGQPAQAAHLATKACRACAHVGHVRAYCPELSSKARQYIIGLARAYTSRSASVAAPALADIDADDVEGVESGNEAGSQYRAAGDKDKAPAHPCTGNISPPGPRDWDALGAQRLNSGRGVEPAGVAQDRATEDAIRRGFEATRDLWTMDLPASQITADPDVLTAMFPSGSYLAVRAAVNGVSLDVGLDSFAAHSMVAEEALESLRVDPASVTAANTLMTGIGQVRARQRVRLHVRFADALEMDLDCLVVPRLPVALILSWSVLVQHRFQFDSVRGVGLSRPGQQAVFLRPTRVRWTAAAVAQARVAQAAPTGAGGQHQDEAAALPATVARTTEQHAEEDAIGGSTRDDSTWLPPLAALEQLPQRHVADIVGAPTIDVTEDPETWYDLSMRPGMSDDEVLRALEASIGPLGTADERAELLEGLKALHSHHPGFFSDKLTHAGRTNVSVQIETTGPVQPQPRRPIAPRYQDKLLAVYQRLRAAGITRRVDSREALHAAANHVIKDKPNGDIRVTTDRTNLNAVSKRDAAPTASPMEILNHAAHAQVFSGLDLTEAFYQFSVHPDSQHLTATYAPDGGLDVWQVLDMGWTNSPAVLHKWVQTVLLGIGPDQVSSLYDDLIMYSTNVRDHIMLVLAVLQRFAVAGGVVNPKKLQLLRAEIRHQGYTVAPGKYRKDPETIMPLLALRAPQSVPQLREVLGIFEGYRSFIPAFGIDARPLYELLHAGVAYEWTANHDGAFQALKAGLARATYQAMPDHTKPMYFRGDGSPKVGISGVVGQYNEEGRYRPIAFFSRGPTAAEQNKGATSMEVRTATAVITQMGRRYATGAQCFYATDGKSMLGMTATNEELDQYTRYDLAKLAAYDVTMVFLPRAEMKAVDALPRYQDGAVRTMLPDETMCPWTVVPPREPRPAVRAPQGAASIALIGATGPGQAVDLVAEQMSDPFCAYLIASLNGATAEVLDAMLQDAPDVDRAAITAYKSQLDRFAMDGLRLVFIDSARTDRKGLALRRIVLPRCLHTRALHAHHASRLANHGGREQTLTALVETYFWHGMAGDVRRHVQNCNTCLRIKDAPPGINTGVTMIKRRPFAHCMFDHIGPLRDTDDKEVFILSMMDTFSGTTFVERAETRTAEETAALLAKRVLLARPVVPLHWQSDNGPEFVGKVFKALAKIMGADHDTGAAHHPQTQGAVEKNNHFIVRVLRSLKLQLPHASLAQLLPYVEATLNNTVKTHGYTPNYVDFGYDALLPFDRLMEATVTDEQLLPIFIESMRVSRAWAQTAQDLAKDERAARFERDNPSAETLQPGEQVMVFVPIRKQRKLEPRYEGPFSVVEMRNDGHTAVLAELDEKRARYVVHTSRLVRARPGETDPDWDQYRQWARLHALKPIAREEAEAPGPATAALAASAPLGADAVGPDPEREWEVADIIDHRAKTHKGEETLEYLVRWRGFEHMAKEHKWLPEYELEHAQEIVQEYWRARAKDAAPTVTRSGRTVKAPRRGP
jgi:transposase InsO family protein